MTNPMQYPLLVLIVSFLVLWASALVGSRFTSTLQDVREGFEVILTATLTLLCLVVGFTFSMAVSRYDQRKLYEEEEANAIGTEYVRSELLPASDRDNVRRLLRQYLDRRILFYETRNPVQLRDIDATTARLQARLWNSVQVAAVVNPTPVAALVVSGMNDVLNSQGYTQAAWRNQIPIAAWVLMGIIAACSNEMVGLYVRRIRSHGILLTVFPAIVSVSFYLIADIESPRGGLIHVTPQNLMGVARSMQD
jgi:hypothetical protein